MSSRFRKDLNQILHPYMFVLKEGNEIAKDLLEYSLLMVSVGNPQTIPSPKNFNNIPPSSNPDFDYLKASISLGLDSFSGF